jgi:hypothetical protein
MITTLIFAARSFKAGEVFGVQATGPPEMMSAKYCL